MVSDLFGASYGFVSLLVEPADCGHSAVARLRRYTFIYLLERTQYLRDAFQVYYEISSQIKRVACTRGRDYMVGCKLTRMLQGLDLAYSRKIEHRPEACQNARLQPLSSFQG